MSKTYAEINEKIRKGTVVVLTAEEMIGYVEEHGVKKAAEDIDVVTTGTFGAMCSSGAWLNFGHSEPPIKMQKVWLNDVEAYTGVAAVDAYIGATQLSETEGIEYGGGHVIEDLVKGEEIQLRATSYGTDCYPRKKIETSITINDLNQAILSNPRNAYQNYAAATNSSDRTIYTYMGKLLPNYGNVTYTTSSQLSPLINDPYLETIGVGTRIFLAGTQGYVIGEGTQFSTEVPRKNDIPLGPAAALSVTADLKRANPKYLKGATYHGYGVSLFVGIGVPIPILNETIARRTAISDDKIFTRVLDYSIPSRSRPPIREVSYAELRSGKIELNGKEVKTSSLSPLSTAREIADVLKRWIEKGDFYLTEPLEKFEKKAFKPMRQTDLHYVKDVMKKAITTTHDSTVEEVSRLIIKNNVNHIPIVKNGKLDGIVTSWDIARAVAEGKKKLDDVAVKNVITAQPTETLGIVAERLGKKGVSALPVVDTHGTVLGIISAEDIAKFVSK